MRLIDANALIQSLPNTIEKEYVIKLINNTPTIEAEPVKHGEWIMGRDMMYCSECAESYDKVYRIDYEYCPNCGAKMKGEEE